MESETEHIPLCVLLRPLPKPRKRCGQLEFDVYDDKSGFDVRICSASGTLVGPAMVGSGGARLRQIAKWLVAIADWTDDQKEIQKQKDS